jgi:hypothetical protein
MKNTKSIILAIFVAIALFGEASGIYAQCSCANAGESAYDELRRSEAVFEGEVIGVKKVESVTNTDYVEFGVTFKIRTVWKTDLPEIVTVRNTSERKDGSDFREKESYLVYAFIYEKVLSAYIGCCTRTKRLPHAAKDLEEFKGKGEKPTRVIKASTFNLRAKPNNSFNRSANSVAFMRET